MIFFNKSKKKNKAIFLLSAVKINDSCFKISFIRDFKLLNQNYKGYFIDEKIVNNDFLFITLNEKDFNKWYKVEVDFYGDILYLHYKKRKISL